MSESYTPTPKDRKQMTDAELIAEFPKIGFIYEGVIHNGKATGLEVRVTRGKEQFLIPTAAINESVALQETLFNLTNIVVIQENKKWLQRHRIFQPLMEKVYLQLFPAADYIRRLFT